MSAELLELFHDAATAVGDAVAGIAPTLRRDRTTRVGQYALDLVADQAALPVLQKARVRVVSEESGVHERDGATVTVVIDPVDGSTNCARGLSYWATSLCAVDGDGLLAALVVNHATGERTTAMRGAGARRDGAPLRPSPATRIEESVISFGAFPRRAVRAKQARMLGSIALTLVDVAAGGLDGHLDGGRFMAPWDYLGGLLVCREAGASVVDAAGEELVTHDPAARRQIIAAGTPALADALRQAIA